MFLKLTLGIFTFQIEAQLKESLNKDDEDAEEKRERKKLITLKIMKKTAKKMEAYQGDEQGHSSAVVNYNYFSSAFLRVSL